MAPPRSAVWRYFKRSADDKSVKCNLCDTELVYKGSTTSMASHLKTQHPQQSKSSPAKQHQQQTMASFILSKEDAGQPEGKDNHGHRRHDSLRLPAAKHRRGYRLPASAEHRRPRLRRPLQKDDTRPHHQAVRRREGDTWYRPGCRHISCHNDRHLDVYGLRLLHDSDGASHLRRLGDDVECPHDTGDAGAPHGS